MTLAGVCSEELEKLEEQGLRRRLTPVEGPQGPRVGIDGRVVVLLCSNDYLGLANHPEVKAAAARALEEYGAGAGASRLVSGDMPPHRELEEKAREFKGAEAALLFNSGYNANLGVINALSDRSTEIFSDKLNHASIVDACMLARSLGATVRRYPHRDVDALERMLKRSEARRKIIVTDGVFSMDGTLAPLPDITSLLDRYDAVLYVDDAHGTGTVGPTGRGITEYFGTAHPSVIVMSTLGKALGSFGAFVTGPKELVELLKSRARPFVYTTALPPSVCAASARALEIVSKDPGLTERLRANSALVRDALNDMGIDTLGSVTQIIPAVIGGAEETMKTAARLGELGVFIQGIRPPTVPPGTSRLRITVTASHTEEDLERSVSALQTVLERSS